MRTAQPPIAQKLLRLAAFSLALVLLASCGWHLRGIDSNAPATIETAQASSNRSLPQDMHLVMWERGSRMAQTLKTILRNKNVALTSSAASTLVLESETVDKRPLAVTETGVTAQYQITLTVNYHYKKRSGDTTTTVIPSRKLMAWRSYDFDAKLIVAKNQEEQALLEEMRQELAYRILAAL
ncbi:LPS assembly lipoprotein LptE [Teredinibacter waterburyi]|jgi:Rare lipoprotein B|uniref:LPS-assembly lipoprotein LptE n=1 Tax=Teredinibacter waterburyi TaxID=1500538 RepID=UPI00165FC09D|nr:LPS assembly lipoprotein LptE [Teredinibacter waterburyi]